MNKDYTDKLKLDLMEIIEIIDVKIENNQENDFQTLLLLNNKLAKISAYLNNKLTTTTVE